MHWTITLQQQLLLIQWALPALHLISSRVGSPIGTMVTLMCEGVQKQFCCYRCPCKRLKVNNCAGGAKRVVVKVYAT